MSDTYLPNFSYLFIPFTTEKLDDFSAFRQNIAPQNGWEPVDINNRYLHRYVAERMTACENAADCRFRLNPEFAANRQLYLGSKQYSTDPKEYLGELTSGFKFLISNVEMYAFDKAICILIFELRFPDSDPLKISSAQYNLRKISTEKIHLDDNTAKPCGESFVDISQRILKDCAQGLALDFFFYATPGNEKANFLTYIDVPWQESYDKELFYLKWCYSDAFDYDNTHYDADNENYHANLCTNWGISVSAAVCLVHRSEKQKAFIEGTFQKNFRAQYLLTYILLLHQKYMMYLFLTKLSVGLEGNLKQLQKYKELLYHFETHYMFSYVSEIPQYQRFYTKIRRIFALEQLFSGVREPLLQLTEMEKLTAENEQKNHEQRVNTALTVLSLLTIVSALTDAAGITSNLEWMIPAAVAKIIQITMLAGVIILSIVTFLRLIFLKKR